MLRGGWWQVAASQDAAGLERGLWCAWCAWCPSVPHLLQSLLGAHACPHLLLSMSCPGSEACESFQLVLRVPSSLLTLPIVARLVA